MDVSIIMDDYTALYKYDKSSKLPVGSATDGYFFSDLPESGTQESLANQSFLNCLRCTKHNQNHYQDTSNRSLTHMSSPSSLNNRKALVLLSKFGIRCRMTKSIFRRTSTIPCILSQLSIDKLVDDYAECAIEEFAESFLEF